MTTAPARDDLVLGLLPAWCIMLIVLVAVGMGFVYLVLRPCFKR
jgi:hypothetical protein